MATTNDHRWVVVFAGARDSYQVPVALHESGLLHKLVTDSYAPLDRPLPAAVAEVLPSPMRSKLRRRFGPALPVETCKVSLRLRNQELVGARRVDVPRRIAG